MPSFLYAERLYLNHHVLSFATKSHGIKSKKNAQPQMFEEEEVELFDLEPYLENLKDIEATAISSFDQITPVTITINDLQNVPVTMKNGSKILGDLAQIVFKTNFLVNLHIFDVSDKNRVWRYKKVI
ncbi:hypothetical protein BEWA_007880 [Theileria equi strain WA]|uniref:Uncharacterized protein n=1 Tax=Theileria equi strain WA TaxID=1537102 RepID=L0B2Q5_THEEQ|nr:hypothetical protein BEWA_007880 [Theileria equi strain WA]AFZ81379.1 hypothetical protein BEWA_007880 [Theileria equi strain WA]|eukprot:XP_004831045.1 hypothetical protein BEWA_007880 [Theileria equi strain WA]